ncbi:MAG: integrase arm-type DNA-binding domain-containing protein, partial [Deltaproteobacteria bacterium]|nr:integrase arm-type DNA-binding domain-containing protein [Deltaproteobacteria bacterium]
MRRKLTDTAVRNAKPADKRYELRDGGGLGLWVYPSGRKQWVCTYFVTQPDGSKRKVRWALPGGEYPQMKLADARAKHQECLALLAEGKDPKHEHQRRLRDEAARRQADSKVLTISELADLYVEKHAKRKKRSWKEEKRQLDKDVKEAWGSRPATSITTHDVQALLDEIVSRPAPVAANRMKSLLSRMFRWAQSRNHVQHNPVKGIEKPTAEHPRDRVLTEEEVRTFWNHLDRTPISDSVRRALRMILVTAQRPGEVAGMRYEEIGEQGGMVVWIIPGSRRKNAKAHLVPLSELALEIVGPWQGRVGPVFGNRKGEAVTPRALAYALRRNIGADEPPPPKKHGLRKRHPIPVAP